MATPKPRIRKRVKVSSKASSLRATSVSVSSSVTSEGSNLACSTRVFQPRTKPSPRKDVADTLIPTRGRGKDLGQARMAPRLYSTTRHVSSSIRPCSSTLGRNTCGCNRPRVGWFQRHKASTP